MTGPAPLPAPSTSSIPDNAGRLLRPALVHGLRGRCPACGEGRLFRSFLVPRESCAACGEDLSGHEAHDFPAYIVILLLGHVIISLMVMVNLAFTVPPYWQSVIWPAATVILALLFIQPVKGAVIAYQWARRMHGFARPADNITGTDVAR